jgi:hypothetical protein
MVGYLVEVRKTSPGNAKNHVLDCNVPTLMSFGEGGKGGEILNYIVIVNGVVNCEFA